jgi:hypothetical protein
MNIHQARLLNIIFAAIMVTNGMATFCWYIVAMHLSLEILNSSKRYLQEQYKVYNFIFCCYSLVLLERLCSNHLAASTEWMINCSEHLLFGIVICIKVYIYTAVFTRANHATRWNRAIIAFVLFNIIALVNEVFQNSLCNRCLFVFIPDSIKDIEMNLLGAAVFMMAVLCRINWLKRMA